MLKRKIEGKILEWYNTDKSKVLFIDGPRQVGKSYIIRQFGKTNFKNYIEINLIKDKELCNSLAGVKSLDTLLLKLSVSYDLKSNDENTLVFIDEIQELDEVDILTLLKFISEESLRCFAFSGSLLGVNLKNYTSWPTGYVFTLDMNALDFEEFCWAFNVSETVLNHLYHSYKNYTKVDDLIHDKMIDLFSLYIILGGMPEVINKYIESKSIIQSNIISNQLNKSYEKDISKYESENTKLYIKNIYNLIPAELNNKNKRFILKNLNEYTKFNKFDSSFLWLNKAGVTIPVFNVNDLNVPLELSKERSLFKLFHNDTGMLINLFADSNLQIKILNKEKDVNFGAIYENVVAKELYVHGYNNLYYFNSKKYGEIDFAIEDNNEITLIEVKSGKDYKTHRALNNVLDKGFNIKNAYVLNNDNLSIENEVIYLPIYMIMFFQKQTANDNKEIDKISFDFSALTV